MLHVYEINIHLQLGAFLYWNTNEFKIDTDSK